MQWIAHVEGGPRRVNQASVVIGNSVYAFGGFQSGLRYRRNVPMDIHILNTVTLRWTLLSKPRNYNYRRHNCPIPFQRYGHSAVAYGKKIYIWGGRNEDTFCNKLFCFDTVSLTWTKPTMSGPVPSPRDGHSACVIKDRMYVFGGFEENIDKLSNELFFLDLIDMKWHAIIPAPNEFSPKFRDFHTATPIGNIMYVFGGRGDYVGPYMSQNEEYCSDIVYFDADTHTWHQPVTTGDLPVGRRSHSAFAMGGKLYIWGGYNGISDEYFNDLFEFNPEVNEWKERQPIGVPPIRRRRQCCAVVNNRAFIFGGTSPWLEVCNAFTGFKPTFLPWLFPYHGCVDDELMNLNDVFVLEFAPTLYRMCLSKVIELKSDTSELPVHIRRDINNWTSPNSVT